MIWKKIFNKNLPHSNEITIFVLHVKLSFRTFAQVSYIDENGNNKIARFFSDVWQKEVLNFVGNAEDLRFKIFVHTPNLSQSESVTLSIETGSKLVLSKIFTIHAGNDFQGWFELK